MPSCPWIGQVGTALPCVWLVPFVFRLLVGLPPSSISLACLSLLCENPTGPNCNHDTSRSRTRRWGRPHHVECLNQNTSPKQRLSLHKHSILFHTGKRSKATCLFVMQHALCCISFLLTLSSWQWQGKNKNEFSSIPFKLYMC